jgi:hypothetical protein
MLISHQHPIDYNTLLTLLPSSSAQHDEAQRSLRMLQPRVEAAQKLETAEMMDKLKGLGNSLLGLCFLCLIVTENIC